MEVILHCFFKLRRVHAISLLNCLIHWKFLDLDRVEVGSSLRKLVLTNQVMHHNPRFCVKERVVHAFLIRRGIVTGTEQIWNG